MKGSVVIVCWLVIISSISVEAQAPGANPLVGTWRLNLAKSKYRPGPPPKSGTTKIEAMEGGIRLVKRGSALKGRQ